MLFVKTYLSNSPIDGLGVFAAENIRAGTLVWKFIPNIDAVIEERIFNSYPDSVQSYLRKYAYFDKKLLKYIICGDDARFVNHSTDPNTVGIYPSNFEGYMYGIDVAIKDINIGEEITCDYSGFDMEYNLKIDSLSPQCGLN
jgi:hypothetical protein